MSLVVKILSRSNPAQSGYTTSGSPSQRKTMVIAQLTGAYETGGVPMTPKLLGLASFDDISFGIVKVNNNTEPTAILMNFASWNGTANKLILGTVAADAVIATNAQTYTVTCTAFGPSVESAPNLP